MSEKIRVLESGMGAKGGVDGQIIDREGDVVKKILFIP